MIEVYQLGAGGNEPSDKRALASVFLKVNDVGILIDAGEGTQMQVCNKPFSCADIDVILITHLHADHVTGLLGVLLAAKSANRRKSIVIYGPKGLWEYVKSFYLIVPKFPFSINVKEIQENQENHVELSNGDIVISWQKVIHSVTCYAYSVELKRGPKFDVERADNLGMTDRMIGQMMRDGNIEINGKFYFKNEFLSGPREGLRICYVVDTRPSNNIRKFVANSDLVFIEGMFRNAEVKAAKKGHMTWREAASMVNDNNIGEVILTHFSPSLQFQKEDAALIAEIMPKGTFGYDGLHRSLNWKSDSVEKKKEVERRNTQNSLNNDAIVEKIGVLKKVFRRDCLDRIRVIDSFTFDVCLKIVNENGVTVDKLYRAFVYKTKKNNLELSCVEKDGYYIYIQ